MSQSTGISPQFRNSILAGVVLCVLCNISMAGFFLMDMGAKSSWWDAAVLFGLSITLIVGSILTGKTIGVLWACQGPSMLVLVGLGVWLMIAGFSVGTTALSMSSGASESVTREAYGSARAQSIQSQIKSAQATVDSLQAQADGLPANYRTRKSEILAQKQQAQQQVMSLNRMLMAAGKSESAIGEAISGMERKLGVEDLTTSAGIYVALAIESLQFFLVCSLGFLSGKRKSETSAKETRQLKKQKPQLRAVQS